MGVVGGTLNGGEGNMARGTQLKGKWRGVRGVLGWRGPVLEEGKGFKWIEREDKGREGDSQT